jgi:lariat debranching enzyme
MSGSGGQNFNRQDNHRGGRGGQWGGGGRGRGRGGGGGRGGRGGQGGRRPGNNWNGQQRSGGNRGNDEIEEMGVQSDHSISIAVEGCCHGELDAIYERLLKHGETSGRVVDLLVCCGDFQSIRNIADFHSLAVPQKYRSLGSFFRYYSGEKRAPIPTIFVGGNHEASQALHELYYGGWVAPNIYYLGAAGVVNFNGVRIAGVSGIYKSHDYPMGRFERPPYDRSSLRSVYHVRSLDVYRLKCLSPSRRLDVMLSHDWPQGIEQHGDTAALLRQKPFFRDEVQQNSLGSPPLHELLELMQPKWWFAAHLHVKFKATVQHKTQDTAAASDSVASLVPSQVVGMPASKASPVAAPKTDDEGVASHPEESEGKVASHPEEPEGKATAFLSPESTDPCAGPDLTDMMTQFLSLDKCLPRRQYLSIVHIPVEERKSNAALEYDPEWLAILRKTHSLTDTGRRRVRLPTQPETATSEEIAWICERLGQSLVIPENCRQTVPAHVGPTHPIPSYLPPPFQMMGNPQTDQLLDILQLDHILTVPFHEIGQSMKVVDENEVDIDDVEGDDQAANVEDENEIDLDFVLDYTGDVSGQSDSNKKPRMEH